jgi:hypothetical protein
MDAIYGPRGNVVAWFNVDHFVALGGATVGWLYDDAVHSLRGNHVGYFTDGLFRDHAGRVVAFVDGATGGPVRPVRHVRPVQPVRHVRPVRPVRGVRQVRGVWSASWSSHSFDDYLGG